MKYLKLFANCVVVKGYMRSIICDLQRNTFSYIPHSLAELFNECGLLDVESVKQDLDKEDKEIFQDYIELLEKEEYVFACSEEESERFPKLDLSWDYHSEISNCIIDIDKTSVHDYYQILTHELNLVNCRHIMFRSFSTRPVSFWDEIIQIVNETPIRSIDIIAMDSPKLFTHDDIIKYVTNNKKIRCFTLHSSCDNREINQADAGFGTVLLVKEKITNKNHCGIIHPLYFSINIETFTESQNFNTCLNRKVGIDVNGDIKNCPSMAISYGNINDASLKDIIHEADFQKHWNINKDQIITCKDCEFRHICTDCRAYLDEPHNIYSKPLKCGYDPYNCQWDEWSNSPFKQKAMNYYELKPLK